MNDVKSRYKQYLDSEEGARKYNEFKDILYGKRDSLVVKLFGIIYPKLKGRDSLRVLDMGGGDGRRLMHLIRLFRAEGVRIEADLVEPSRTFTKNARKTVLENGYTVRVERNTFEDFEPADARGYDLILSIHSIYTFRDDSYLKKVRGLLRPGGLAVFVVNDGSSFLGGLKRITDASYGTSRNEIDSLMRALEGVPHRMLKFDTIFSGVSGAKGLNRKGNLILEWIGMRPLSDIPMEVRVQAARFFARRTRGGSIREKEVVVMVGN